MKRMKCMLVGAALCAMSLCGGLYAQQQEGAVGASDVAIGQKEEVKITRGERVEVVSLGDEILGTYSIDPSDKTGMVALVGVFVVSLLIAYFALLFPYLKRKKQMEVAEAAILHGQQLPPEFFDEGKPQRSFLQRGVTQIAVGVALTVAVGVVVDWDIALFGLVVVALGVGNVLAHFLGAKEQKTDGQ